MSEITKTVNLLALGAAIGVIAQHFGLAVWATFIFALAFGWIFDRVVDP